MGMSFEGSQVMVVGMARSGLAAVRLLAERGAQVIAYDAKSAEQLPDVVEALGSVPGVRLELGGDAIALLEQVEALFISPGVPIDSALVLRARELGRPVLGEVELGYLFTQCPIVAITGTNGKTTTTALTGQMFRRAGYNTHVVGNIGDPICAHALDTRPEDMMVLEISSFQLESIDSFRPRVSVILNLSPDHLNRHHTMQAYIDAKARVFENQRGDDVLILNWDDPQCRALATRARCRVAWFSRMEELQEGCFLKDGRICWRWDGQLTAMGRPEEVRIPGQHNLENALAASACAMYMGVSPQVVRHTLASFEGVEHRLEFVIEHQGVRFFNDSKATNPDSSIKDVQAMNLPTILIAGGYDKGTGYGELADAIVAGRVAGLVVMGATADQVARAAAERGFAPIVHATSLEDAVYKAYAMTHPGYNVLFSPASASFDMFRDFEERGRVFKEIVARLVSETERR